MRDKNGVGRHRTPEGFGFERNYLKRVFQGYSVEFNPHPPRSVIGIEKHVDAGQFSDRFINHLGIFGEFESDGNVGNRRKFDRTLCRIQPPSQGARSG